MNTVIHIKANKEVKENAQRLAKELGLSLSDVINASLRNFLRTRKITFSSAPRMTPELERLLGPIVEDIKKGRNLSPAFDNAEDMDKYLNSL